MVGVLDSSQHPCWAADADASPSQASDSQSAQSDGTGISIGSLSRCSSISSTLLAHPDPAAALSTGKVSSDAVVERRLGLAPLKRLLISKEVFAWVQRSPCPEPSSSFS